MFKMNLYSKFATALFVSLIAQIVQPCTAKTLEEIHIKIVDPNAHDTFNNLMRELPDQAGVRGGWVKDEAIRSAINKDPKLLLDTLTTLSDPGRGDLSLEFLTPGQVSAARQLFSALPQIPIGTSSFTVQQAVAIVGAANTLLLEANGLDPASKKAREEEVIRALKSRPLLLDYVVSEVRSGLETAGTPGSRPALVHSELEKFVKKGRLPDIANTKTDDLINSLPANSVSMKIASLLSEQSAADISRLKSDGLQMKAFLKEKVYPSLIDQGLMLNNLKNKTDKILQVLADQQEKAAAQADHDR